MVTFTRTKLIVIAAVTITVLVAVLCAVFLTQNSDTEPSNGVIATTKLGKVAGEWVDADDPEHFKYLAFRGIPYAKPPLGNLRFQAPKPFQPWDGVRSATTEGNDCAQSGTQGSEDCLYLNVYTPQLPSGTSNPKLAVYVFIHGGAFQHGSGSAGYYGPDFLVQHNIVVVTMNYRIGILAGLALDTDEVPGNAGLKDQLHALRWVNENIENFGGDPSKVTLGGHSSGSVSASWLSILPQTRGLIRAAIVQSGTAVHSWAYHNKHIEFAKAVYKHLTGTVTDDTSEMARVFKSAAYLDLYNAAESATITVQADKGLGTDITFFYAPYIERRPPGKEEKLITQDPESYIIQAATNIPMIVGETKQEWTLFFSDLDMFGKEAKLIEKINDLRTYVSPFLIPGDTTQKLLDITEAVPKIDVDNVVSKIRDQYFSDKDPSCCDNCKMAKYLHQVYIMADVSHFLRLRSKYIQQPTFAFMFNLKSDYNKDLKMLPTYLQSDVVHGDEIPYIWKRNSFKYNYGNDTASIASKRLVGMIANFVKEGNPTPEQNDIINVKWQPVTNGGDETYLEISETLDQRVGSLSDSDVWPEIFETFRAQKSP